jgi:hypothetical protein
VTVEQSWLAWNGGTVGGLVHEIYWERAFEPTFRTRVRELYFPLRRGQKEKLQDPPPG